MTDQTEKPTDRNPVPFEPMLSAAQLHREKWLKAAGELANHKPPAPVVAVPLNEWSLLHRRLGYLEGVLKGLRYTEDLEKSLDQIAIAYAEIK